MAVVRKARNMLCATHYHSSLCFTDKSVHSTTITWLHCRTHLEKKFSPSFSCVSSVVCSEVLSNPLNESAFPAVTVKYNQVVSEVLSWLCKGDGLSCCQCTTEIGFRMEMNQPGDVMQKKKEAKSSLHCSVPRHVTTAVRLFSYCQSDEWTRVSASCPQTYLTQVQAGFICQ